MSQKLNPSIKPATVKPALSSSASPSESSGPPHIFSKNSENSGKFLTCAAPEGATESEKAPSDSAAIKPCATKALKVEEKSKVAAQNKRASAAPLQTAAGSSLALRRLQTHRPASGRTLDRTLDNSKFTWVRAGSKGPKGSAAVAASGESGCGPIRRSRVSALSKASYRYQWVCRVQRPGPGPKTGPLSPKGRNRFTWSAPQRSEVVPQRSEVTTETGSAFKLSSRRSSPGPSEVRTPVGPKPGLRPRSGSGRTLVSRHKLRRISPGLSGCKVQSRPETKSGPQFGPAKSRTKDLVSVSRHKLRRINPGLSRSQTSPSSPGTRTRTESGQASGSEFRSRFKMDKRNVSRTRILQSPALSWRNRRVQSARSFLQSRLRPLPPPSPLRHTSRAPSTAHMCWIRGSLYRVSANRLSRAPPPRRSAGPAPLSPASSASRHLARSVLQRSLSVARSSLKLKNKQRQFCVFYNRFGRCNRGTSCAFTHDPDKVAVCTRFLRGRCKHGDSCTFSHKVSKDKMPVCQFFLRGVCSNSECPYSHVYVSRKAQVCEDFLRGYCPEGQKCKKKHTLFCSDTNCSRGDACKLQHKRPIRRSAAKKPRPQAKRNRAPDPAAVHSSSEESGPDPGPGPGSGSGPDPGPGPGSGSGPGPLQKLPSFISLCSSPEEPDASPGGAVLSRGRILQIKPRFENLNN